MVLFTRGHFPIHQKASALTFSMLNSLGGHNFDLMVNGFGTVYNLNPIYLDSKAAVAFVVITNLVTASTNLLRPPCHRLKLISASDNIRDCNTEPH